ncbi:MAG TPA: family 10 glycosylhydrolase [Verrucomicrobiae bacterium]
MNRKIIFCAAALLFLAARLPATDETNSAAKIFPPPPAREFRAAWITEVAVNPDWPSQQGLPANQQKTELLALLDKAQQLHLNAVFFQVRPACDAFYSSSIEPWSDRITGVMGKGPEPFYDPLAFAIAEAHRHGLQLHAWFNPFRAAHPSTKSPPAASHITRTHPELIRHYADQVWLDPGEPAARARTLAVVLDVVKRYDVDGVVFDDYFYPYPQKDWAKRELDFPDDASWKKYGVSSGLTREDWRRSNVNQLVQKTSQKIKAVKPQVQFGISPFGIWRPGVPAGISPKALDAYGRLYADSRAWLANGWVDYLAPQLYWPIAPREESFPALLQWWRQQNIKCRHVFAALNDAAVGKTFSTDEIARQIQVVRTQTSNGGEIHYHLRSVTENPALATAVRAQYAQPALVPASPWIAATPLVKPKLTVTTGNNSAHIRWENSNVEPPRNWLFQSRTNGIWTTQIFPVGRTDCYLDKASPDAISLRAVDRLGNLSEPAVWTPKKYTSPDTAKGAAKMR